MVFLNRGDHFELHPLPLPAQVAPAFGLVVADFNGDGKEDLFLNQNFFALPPDVSRYDGGRGLLLTGNGDGTFEPVSGAESGLEIYGEGRGSAALDYDRDGRVDLVAGQNANATKLYHNLSAKPGLRVRLKGGARQSRRSGRRAPVALCKRTIWPGPRSAGWRRGPVARLAVQVLGLADPATSVSVKWPGGKTIEKSVIPGDSEVTIAQ